MEKKVTSIAEWINNGRLLEGNEPFESRTDRELFFFGLCNALANLGWASKLDIEAPEQTVILEKGENKYSLVLKDGRSYKFKKEN